MSGKGKSILVFGIYLVITGITLLFEPNILLKILGIRETQEIWIRITGCLTINIGVFNIMAAYSGVKKFYSWMYIARGIFIASILSFVILKQAPYIFLLFGVVDLLGMAWTYLAAE
jgi:hypothetical protein